MGGSMFFLTLDIQIIEIQAPTLKSSNIL